ncbi:MULTISPECIES: RpiB/LacA/LacB family sugar-phosphate isomerase [Streptomyces]|uniref:Sugar-phosphate isomerase, RpiB/LacA/LacB family n=1 Tax=Streptomyces violaceusniger (strain Tu 4113) TaxID=653045 RepID=G2P3C0_STRV4|nr:MULTISPECIES: RpiB/LacA/LacB family sugar-phosphate isomerase [Streptomyces]AEM82994.1 sugar-phosphate isomerase, RpiB/LacA/LacB family [Streptomyces violaceusniger Tu 4113]MBO3679790.1 RpiB/LacA/LacB family sugar-phosphate isomerase [Streptomyces sp. NEAU-YJ-81]
MRIALGNDHAGLALKEHVRQVLRRLGHEVADFGPDTETPVDFPDITFATCDAVRRGEADRAVLVCGTGAGALMAANKIAGIRCGLGHDVYSAHQAVEHDDANALAMGAWLIGPAMATEVLEAFLAATFDDDADTVRRVAKLRDLELRSARELADRI